MRILLVASLAESLINFRGPLINALLDRGLDVVVAAPDFRGEDIFRGELESRGVGVYDIYMQRTGVNPFSDFRCLLSLWWLMFRIKPDVFLGYTIKPVTYGILAAWLAGVNKRFALITGVGYAFIADKGVRGFSQVAAQILYRISLYRASKVFFQNPDDEKLFREKKIMPKSVPSVVVNGSGIDLSKFVIAPIKDSAISFLLIARLLASKGIREYVMAAERIRTNFPKVKFSLAGWIDKNPDSIDRAELDSWIRAGTIEYLGRLSDVRSAIADCSVYVLPSYREGTPRTVLEAMAIGRPIITTDAPGCRETVIDGANGFLVAIRSVDELEYAMTRLITQPELMGNMGTYSRFLAEQKYDVNQINEAMITEMDLS